MCYQTYDFKSTAQSKDKEGLYQAAQKGCRLGQQHTLYPLSYLNEATLFLTQAALEMPSKIHDNIQSC